MKRFSLFVIVVSAVLAASCSKEDSIGGTINSTELNKSDYHTIHLKYR